jgi:hypothetical protein
MKGSLSDAAAAYLFATARAGQRRPDLPPGGRGATVGHTRGCPVCPVGHVVPDAARCPEGLIDHLRELGDDGRGNVRTLSQLWDVDHMKTFFLQLPALIGVLVGALATYAATAATERARWRRAQSVRWDEKRVNAYAEYAHALKQVISVALRLAALRDAHPEGDRVPSEDELAALDEAEVQRTIKWEAVLLLGSDDVVIAGRRWHQGAFNLERLAYGEPCDMSLMQAIDTTGQARRNFYEVAKRDIGIEVGSAPEVYEWQLSKLAGGNLDEAGELNWYRSQRSTDQSP